MLRCTSAMAMQAGKGEAFTRSFLRGVWSEGIEAGRDKGLRQICCAAGLDWQDCKAVIDNQGWRDMAMQNQEDLLALGLWGVPSFALDSASYWGEDRLWAVENQLKAGR